MVPLSILDLAPITQGGDAAAALRHSLDLARHAERWGYRRFWVAEHHNMPGIASAATAVVIAHVAQGTSTIRVGAGGIMLPNHAPLIVAEQFGTLESLFPGRIDLGLGRAPGTDQTTAMALRRTLASNPDLFPQDVLELMAYFHPDDGQRVRAVPGAGLHVPIYILGSSLFGAQVAAAFGLPFAFASHFAAQQMLPAVRIYRERFKPSEDWPRPYVMLGINIIAAETDGEARLLATSGRKSFASLRAGTPIPLPPPDPEWEKDVVPFDAASLETLQAVSFVGGPGTVREGLDAFVARTQPDELIVVSHVYDHAARLRSYRLAAHLAV
ncbi:MAG TPA: LLM class flavin-dependent oxidoreductase [Vicinamibacterales bacterium]|nr:LLM class flavin-dependent oxidoreductase [Vicinamibacterales bacterium]